jgi:ketosteroid isomerase-like protein
MMERITQAQNAHDALGMAALFDEDYVSAQPVHPGRAFTGRTQVYSNWSALFQGVPDFRAELVGFSSSGETEWGELDWRGRFRDGSPFAMRGVVILTIRDHLIAEGRLYMEPVDQGDEDIDAAVEELSKPTGSPST